MKDAGAPRTDKQLRGQAGEDAALQYLLQQGLRLVQRNFLCKLGEIDLVMQDGETLVFVEVRQRAVGRFGGAAASITPAKQRRMWHAAQVFLQRYRKPPACRIDVVAIDGTVMNWIRNALSA